MNDLDQLAAALAPHVLDWLDAEKNVDEFLQPEPCEYSCKVVNMSWMRMAGEGFNGFTHWFVCRWMKNPCRPNGVTFTLASHLQYWSPNAVPPGEWS